MALSWGENPDDYDDEPIDDGPVDELKREERIVLQLKRGRKKNGST